jgi:hypothetical protein
VRLYPSEHCLGKSKDKLRIRCACIALSSGKKENMEESGILDNFISTDFAWENTFKTE